MQCQSVGVSHGATFIIVADFVAVVNENYSYGYSNATVTIRKIRQPGCTVFYKSTRCYKTFLLARLSLIRGMRITTAVVSYVQQSNS